METTGALIVAFLCAVAAIVGLQFVRDVEERKLLARLFFAAFALRTVFTFLCYFTGIINILGGADDVGWRGAWGLSQQWRMSGPDSFWSLYDPTIIKSNPGWRYFSTLFYYLLGIRSQMALAIFNGFLNSLTVLVIYKVAREFFSRRASVFAASAAVIMPGFLIWSALTIKETWLILFEITVLFTVLRLSRRFSPLTVAIYIPLAIVLVALSLAFRFYVMWFLIGGAAVAFVCLRSQRPLRAAGLGMAGVALLFILLSGLRVVRFDPVGLAEARVAELTVFRNNISDYSQAGTNSAVQLDYDTSTPVGALKMLVVGGFYVLLSPFPWQVFGSTRQIAALPDVLLWWYLVLGFILPGFRYAWNRQRGILLAALAFFLPLFMFYSMMFGNIGLAYRQRAQLMPFLLVLVAAGYASRHRELEEEKVDNRRKVLITRLLLLRLQSEPVVSSALARPSSKAI